jgi:hypothetical protein
VDILADRLAQARAELVARGYRCEVLQADIAERAQCIAAAAASGLQLANTTKR